jgi:hypothetical protein
MVQRSLLVRVRSDHARARADRVRSSRACGAARVRRGSVADGPAVVGDHARPAAAAAAHAHPAVLQQVALDLLVGERDDEAATMRLEFSEQFLESLNGKHQYFSGERSQKLRTHLRSLPQGRWIVLKICCGLVRQ